MSAVGTTQAEDGHRAGMRSFSRVRGEGWDEVAFSSWLGLAVTPPHPYCGACHRAGHFGPDPLAIRPLPAQRGRGKNRIDGADDFAHPTWLTAGDSCPLQRSQKDGTRPCRVTADAAR
jgi:hypothetical protein